MRVVLNGKERTLSARSTCVHREREGHVGQGQALSLLVALGGGPGDAELLAAARGVAAAAGWALRAVHVREPEVVRAPRRTLAALDARRASRSSQAEGATVTEIGRLAAAGVAAVAFGARATARPGLGGVALALLGALDVPCSSCARARAPVDRLRRLVVPLEGSPSASAAMQHADDAFCARGREIVMLHVVTSDSPLEPGSLPAPRIVDQEHYEWAAWQEEFTMRFSQCVEGGRHRVCVRVGDPATGDHRARPAHSTPSSSSSRGAAVWPRTAPRSCARCSRTSPCPVYLVPAGV